MHRRAASLIWTFLAAMAGLLIWAGFQAPDLLAIHSDQPSEPPAAATALLPEPLSSALQHHRMTVFFYPRIENCTPHELRIARALRRVEQAFPDVQIYTVLPQGAEVSNIYGSEVPGRTLSLPITQDRETATMQSPRPRIEVWEPQGSLLLLRSVPQAATEEDVYEEVSFARSFTRPLESDA